MNWYKSAQFTSTEPWQLTISELRQQLLFHGTGEPIEGDLRGGGYDSILWTADSPDIAQNYIPIAGSIVYFQKPREDELNDSMKPDRGSAGELLEQMGLDVSQVEYDNAGRVKSWSTPIEQADKWKKSYFIHYIENVLGYQPNSNGYYEVYSTFQNDKHIFLPANEKLQGELFMFLGKEKLNLYDYATGREGDLTDPDYHQIDLFERIQEEGYDGIIIHDWAQSKNFGNVGHNSIGIFSKGLEKLKQIRIPATNHDWASFEEQSNRITPEFIEWHKSQVGQALKEGKPVPAKVLQEYPEMRKI